MNASVRYTVCPLCNGGVAAGELLDRFQCGECNAEYDTEQEAEECCAETEEEPKEE